MTGRRAGYCAGYGVPGFASFVPGRGFGGGRGWSGGWGGGWGGGRGWRHWYYATGLPGWARFGYAPAWGEPPAWGYGPDVAPPSPQEEAGFLKRQAEWLQQQLDAISQRIQELEQEA